jgi:CubicO group peptidase (beta-lactamase class C family)
MKKLLLLSAITFLLTIGASAQALYFPPTVGNTWSTMPITDLGWCQDRVDSLYDYLEGENSKAFILLKDGKIVLERYFGTFTQDSLWYWASAGKTLTGFTVGIAQQEGHLNIGDTTSDYIGTGWTSATLAQEEKITIRHQLSMTSGLDELAAGDPNCTLPSCLPYLADAGTRWAYHTGVYTRLDSVIENATGMTLNAYINQKIKVPTGMTGSFFQVGYNNLFVSKPRSMARFGLLLLNKGNWNGTPILTDTSYFHDMTHPSQSLNNSYGYLTWLNGQSSYLLPYLQIPIPGPICPSAPADMYAAIGKNGQIINVVPSQNLVFIRMGNASNSADVSTLLCDTIWQFINALPCSVNGVGGDVEVGSFKVWPNPATDRVNVEYVLDDAGKVAVELVDLQGRVLLRMAFEASQGKGHRVVALPEGLARGLYWIALTTESGRIVRKVVH